MNLRVFRCGCTMGKQEYSQRFSMVEIQLGNISMYNEALKVAALRIDEG